MMAGDGYVDADDPVLHDAAVAFGEFCTTVHRADRGPAGRRLDRRHHRHPHQRLRPGRAGPARRRGRRASRAAACRATSCSCSSPCCSSPATRPPATPSPAGSSAFTRFPDQHQKLLDDPSLMATWRSTRSCATSARSCRSCARSPRTTPTRASTCEAGDRLLLLYQSANRDEAVFDDPDEFRVDRDPNPHLGFGIGTHYCLGANLARAEISVVFEELFGRLRDIRAVDADTLDRGDSTLVLALSHLPAVFTPGAPAVTATARRGRRRPAPRHAASSTPPSTLVSERGAAGTSMRRLAAACGLNVATIYHYFPSKADLLRAAHRGAALRRADGHRRSRPSPPSCRRGSGWRRSSGWVCASGPSTRRPCCGCSSARGCAATPPPGGSAAELLADHRRHAGHLAGVGLPGAGRRATAAPAPTELAVVVRAALLGSGGRAPRHRRPPTSTPWPTAWPRSPSADRLRARPAAARCPGGSAAGGRALGSAGDRVRQGRHRLRGARRVQAGGHRLRPGHLAPARLQHGATAVDASRGASAFVFELAGQHLAFVRRGAGHQVDRGPPVVGGDR